MQKIISFLTALQAHNNREWFNDHKSWYVECKEMFDEFTTRFIAGIREFDDSIGPLTVKDCTYRIYRDTRFSADKTPYKTHFGAFVVPGGKKSGFSGYYLQIGANDKGYPGGCMLASGDYCCDTKVLRILREDISGDNGRQFAAALEAADGFHLDYEGALKRVPNGFPADKPYSDWLRLKNFCLLKEPGREYMLRDDMLERALADFRTTMPFLNLINNAVAFVRDENGDKSS